MTKRKLILELCKKEKGKEQVNVAQMTDVVNRLIEMEADWGKNHSDDDLCPSFIIQKYSLKSKPAKKARK